MTNLFLMPLNAKRGVIYALIALAETAWLTPLLASRITEDPAHINAWFWSLLFLAATAILLGWLSDAYQMPLEVSRAAGLILAGFGILLMIRVALYPEIPFLQLGWIATFIRELFSVATHFITLIWIIVGVGYIWQRLLYVGHTPPVPSIVWFTLQIGFVGYLIILLFSSFRPEAAPSLFLLLTYVCCALLAMTLSYTQPIEEYHGTAAVGPFQKRALNGIAAVALVLLTAFILGSIFSFPVLQRIFDVIFGLVGAALKPLFALFILFVQWLAPLLERLIEFLSAATDDSNLINPTPQAQATLPPIELAETDSEPIWWAQYITWILWAGATAVVIFVFYRFTCVMRQRYKKDRISTGMIVNESLSVDGSGLKEMLSGNLKKLAKFINMVSQFGLGGDLRAAATIKRIYAAMTVLTRQRGVERAEYQTPLEFLEPLISAWPGLSNQFSAVTNAYINVHYGQLPESASSLAQVQAAWETIYETIISADSVPPKHTD